MLYFVYAKNKTVSKEVMDMPDTRLRKPPESLGIDSCNILEFLDRIEEHGVNMHSFILARHGCLAVEGYWAPYSADKPHRIYSSGKTVGALAIGLLIGEGRLSLDDRIIDLLPDKAPIEPHPYVDAMTVRDLLMMATPFKTDCYYYGMTDRVHDFLHQTPDYEPGTKFSYNTSATYTLNVITERLTGERLIDYLRPRLFDPIGVSHSAKCLCMPDGHSHSGSSMIILQRDFSLIVELVMRRGEWNGLQLIPRSFMDEMTSPMIDNTPKISPAAAPKLLHHGNGYGYQLWMLPGKDRFFFSGMGDQNGFCLADLDLTFCCMADNQGPNSSSLRKVIFDSLMECIVDRLTPGDLPLPENSAVYDALLARLSKLQYAVPRGSAESPLMPVLDRAVYSLEPCSMGITKLSFTFDGDRGVMRYENAQGEKELPFGLCRWENILFPQTGYPGSDYMPSDELYKCIAAGAFENNTLRIKVQSTGDFIGNIVMEFRFDGDDIAVSMRRGAQFFFDEYNGDAKGKRIKAH